VNNLSDQSVLIYGECVKKIDNCSRKLNGFCLSPSAYSYFTNSSGEDVSCPWFVSLSDENKLELRLCFGIPQQSEGVDSFFGNYLSAFEKGVEN
jgi:hypothetical protein